MRSRSELGTRLREARAHLTQPALAALLSEHARRKVHAGTISRYERGRLVPTARILHAYCAGLGLDASELLRLAAAD